MSRLGPKALQRKINLCARAYREASEAESVIYDHCMTVYGATPSDIDCETLLDSVFGSGGAAQAVTVEEFNEAMKDSIEISGFERDEND